MKPNTMKLATTLRQELAWNAHDDLEANLRCVCDECVTALAEEQGLRLVDPSAIAKAFKALDEAAWGLPIPFNMLTIEGQRRVQKFEQAKHAIHVLLHGIAAL